MKIGIMHGGDSLVPGRGVPSNWKIYNFKNIPKGWSSFDLPYSAFATPARYLAEMVRRLIPGELPGDLILFNPWLEPGKTEVALVLQSMRYKDVAPEIVSDRNGIPVAYRLAANDLTEIGKLALLSCIDADLDSRLLCALLGRPVQVKRDSMIDLRLAVGNGYSSHQASQRILRWMAEHALRVISGCRKLGKELPSVFAVLPYHAGDLLFFGLAHHRVEMPIISGVVVAGAFEDIVREVSPSLQCRVIALQSTRSDGDAAWENRQFDEICSRLVDDHIYYYCRPLRPYDAAEYHLLDQYAFAVGHDGCSSLVKEAEAGHDIRAEPAVLLHFDGGWPLKVYPQQWRQQLIQMLASRGYRVTTLTDDPEAVFTTHRNVRFSNLNGLKHLIEQNSVLIGMDSFPCHLAAHVLGIRTICLFACTQPSNSDAPASSRYIALEQHLSCRPCGAYSTCPLYGGKECRNFVPPVDVVSALEKIQGMSI